MCAASSRRSIQCPADEQRYGRSVVQYEGAGVRAHVHHTSVQVATLTISFRNDPRPRLRLHPPKGGPAGPISDCNAFPPLKVPIRLRTTFADTRGRAPRLSG